MSNKSILAILVFGVLHLQTYAQEYFYPEQGKGPLVVVLSGASGPDRYQDLGNSISRLGYSVLLIDGKDVPPNAGFASSNLKRYIIEAQTNKKVKSGNVVVIGLSLGGGGALVTAVQGDNSIVGVIAMYPAISKISRLTVASKLQVPTMIFVGGQDTFYNCCLVEYANEYVSSAKNVGKKVDLVVYPNAGHGFNLKLTPGYREEESNDSFNKIQKFLQNTLPIE